MTRRRLADPLTIAIERDAFAIKGAFRIARGAKTAAETLTCVVTDGRHAGRGECVPYARYGETMTSVADQIAGLPKLALQGDGAALHDRIGTALPPGAARNAVDCAVWDLRAKRAGLPVHDLIGVDAPRSVPTAVTVSLDTPEAMARAARQAAVDHSLIKAKLGGDGHDIARMQAMHAAAPNARFIMDANESWHEHELARCMAQAASCGAVLIEQPLPAGDDAALATMARPVPVCADESVHTNAELDTLIGRYDAINIKLDKTGGLTEALAMQRHARALGFAIMVGCMVGSSLSMAPAVILAQDADFIDLDGPLLLAEDRDPPLRYTGERVHPPQPALWG